LGLSTGCLSGLLFRIEERVRTKASIFFFYHQDLLLRNLVRKQWLFSTFDNTWMNIDPNQKDDSEKRGRNKEARYGSYLFRMNQYGFIIIDELFLLQHVRLQAMSDVVYLTCCKEGSLQRMITHNGGEAAPNNTLQPSLKSGLL
jgi:hypothetical protein